MLELPLGITASLQHMSSFRPLALGAVWTVATSTGHSWELPRRWRLPPAVPIPPHWHKDIPVNPRALHSSGKKQDDHQELPNSLLTTAACSRPAHPGGSVQRKQNLSLWRQGCFCCQKGRTNHCLYIWSCHVLHLELKTALPGPISCCFFYKQGAHLQSPSTAYTKRAVRISLGGCQFFSRGRNFQLFKLLSNKISARNIR